MPLTGATSRVYPQIQIGLVQFGFLLLGLGLGGLGARAHGGQLLRRGLGGAQVGFRLLPFGLGLRNHLLGGSGVRPGSGDSSGARPGRGDRLVILLVRNFLLVHQLFVAPDVVLRLDVIGDGLLQLGSRRLELLARHGNSGASALHFRLRRRQLAAGIDRRDRNVHLHGFGRGLGILIGGPGLRHRHLVVLGINLDQRRARLHKLIVVDQKLDDVSGDTRADGVQVAINLRVVGGLVAAQVAPEKEAGHQQHNSAHDQGQAKAGIAGGLLPAEIFLRSRQGRMFASFNFRRFGHGRRCGLFHITCSSDIACTPCSAYPMARTSSSLGKIVSVQAGNIAFVGRRHRLLRLDYFQVVGNAGGKSVAGLRQGLFRQID